MASNDNVTTGRQHAGETFSGAVEQATRPLVAAVGASELAAQTVLDTLGKVRTQLNEQAEAARDGVRELPAGIGQVREQLEPAQLRTRIEGYTASAAQFYRDLGNRGEGALGRLRSQPPVRRVWSQFDTAQENVGQAVSEVRDFADSVLGNLARSTRSVGEKAARGTTETTDEAAETVREAANSTAETVRETGIKAAAQTRSSARKAANTAENAQSDSRTSGSAKPGRPSGSSGSANTGASKQPGPSGEKK